ncbi:uncharacterized protein LOC135812130 isoform X2 [Sycon ciliatum]|uniref:uncharacterized protein LOC135812130 isoform X2 n=1 Tax=Sycon ciliatum TaxID=27933 RepID=UPI0031F6BC3B
MAIGGCSPLRFLAIASTVIFCMQPVDAFEMLELYRFDNQEVSEFSARCVDGSPSGFYFEPGLQSRKRGFYFKGGGLCASKESCQARTESDLGSSNSWASAMSGFGLVSSNASENNGVCMWNHVYLSYCSGDMHYGQQTQPYSSGHLTVVAVHAQLRKVNNLNGFNPCGFAGSIPVDFSG